MKANNITAIATSVIAICTSWIVFDNLYEKYNLPENKHKRCIKKAAKMFEENDFKNGKNDSPTLEWHIEHDKIAAELLKCTRAIPKSK